MTTIFDHLAVLQGVMVKIQDLVKTFLTMAIKNSGLS